VTTPNTGTGWPNNTSGLDGDLSGLKVGGCVGNVSFMGEGDELVDTSQARPVACPGPVPCPGPASASAPTEVAAVSGITAQCEAMFYRLVVPGIDHLPPGRGAGD
jgi:hypothetical protein